MKRFDHVVVGAGIVGSCAALQLVKSGKKVLLLEQFLLPHTRGSSHGQTRLIRSCYPDDFYARIMPLAFDQWKELEDSSGQKLLHTTGILCLSKRSSDSGMAALTKSRSNMLDYSPEHLECLTNDQLHERFPMMLFDKDYEAFIDKSGGVIYANKALSAVQELFKTNGGELWDGCRVGKIIPEDDVTVMTSREHVTCDTVVVCAGAWTEKLIKEHLTFPVGLQAEAVKVYYFKEEFPLWYSTDSGFMPFRDLSSVPRSVYGIPRLEYPGLIKVTVHGGSPCDPDAREKAESRRSLDLEEFLIDYVKEHLTGVDPQPAIVENCMYTMTYDEVCIVDTLPRYKNIVVATGFSGTGFKTAPIFGKILSELAQGLQPSYDITPFNISRMEEFEATRFLSPEEETKD